MAWPVPFADGLPVLLALRGRRVVMLASGDPFWFGAGTSVAKMLAPGEWVALPGALDLLAGGKPAGLGAGGCGLPWPARGPA